MDQQSIIAAQRAFGRAVRTFRTKAGLSQEQLAQQSGVHRNYVGDVERAEENISLITILRLCKALNISVGKLVREMEAGLAQGNAPPHSGIEPKAPRKRKP